MSRLEKYGIVSLMIFFGVISMWVMSTQPVVVVERIKGQDIVVEVDGKETYRPLTKMDIVEAKIVRR